MLDRFGVFLARAARDFFKVFDILVAENAKFRSPAGAPLSEWAHNSLSIGIILDILQLSKDWINIWHPNRGPYTWEVLWTTDTWIGQKSTWLS